MTTSISGLGLAQQAIGYTPPVVTPAGPMMLWLYPNAAGTATADVLLLFADPTGRVLGELAADLTGAAWKLNSYGQARLNVARDRVDEEDVRPGNRLAVLFDNGLPAWGGVIDVPRPWNGPVMTVNGYSAEYLLTFRRLRGGFRMEATASEVMRQLLGEAQQAGRLGLEVGGIQELGSRGLWQLNAQNLLTAVTTVAAGYGDFYAEPVVQGGTLSFLFNFVARRGVDHGRMVALEEGANLTRTLLNDQGPIANEWTVYGGGTGWTPPGRIVATAADMDSIGLYGLRQETETDNALTTQGVAEARAGLELADTAELHAVVGMDALDRPPGRWGQYDVGDSVWVELYSQGMGGVAGARRVTAREYLGQTNVCRLVME